MSWVAYSIKTMNLQFEMLIWYVLNQTTVTVEYKGSRAWRLININPESGQVHIQTQNYPKSVKGQNKLWVPLKEIVYQLKEQDCEVR